MLTVVLLLVGIPFILFEIPPVDLDAAQKIAKGMNSKEVVRILGDPDAIYQIDNRLFYKYYRSKLFWSEYVVVLDNGLVVEAFFDD
jgi:hypothetical protein